MLVFLVVLTLVGGPLISRPIAQSVTDAAADARQTVADAPPSMDFDTLLRLIVDHEVARGIDVAIIPPPEVKGVHPSDAGPLSLPRLLGLRGEMVPVRGSLMSIILPDAAKVDAAIRQYFGSSASPFWHRSRCRSRLRDGARRKPCRRCSPLRANSNALPPVISASVRFKRASAANSARSPRRSTRRRAKSRNHSPNARASRAKCALRRRRRPRVAHAAHGGRRIRRRAAPRRLCRRRRARERLRAHHGRNQTHAPAHRTAPLCRTIERAAGHGAGDRRHSLKSPVKSSKPEPPKPPAFRCASTVRRHTSALTNRSARGDRKLS